MPRRTTGTRSRAPQPTPDTSCNFAITAAEASSTPSGSTTPVVLFDSLSYDLRRVFRDSVALPSPASSSATLPATPQVAQEPLRDIGSISDWDPFFVDRGAEEHAPTDANEAPGLDGDAPPNVEDAAGPAPRYTNSDEPMNTWVPMAPAYLDENLRFEGRGDFVEKFCPGCALLPHGERRAPTIRCLDCSPRLYCEECTVGRHSGDLPFHRVQRWTGRSFEHVTLRELGLIIQLGHADGSECSRPHFLRADFCVVELNGQHKVDIRFCGCDEAGSAGSRAQQLMRRGLYPATDHEPHTAFTYRLLEHYHLQSLQGKVSMYDYYRTLERLTDNTGTKHLQDRYKAFMRVVAQWRFLKRLKRAGRAHCPDGVVSTKHGELAVACPACPRPGVNLPTGWDAVQDELKYLYTISVSMDACFRFKRRAVSNEEKDPILGSGWGYFVEDKGYKAVLAEYGDQEEMSTCTGLSAIDHANSKHSKGYAATGIGAVFCSRHEFMLANGCGDTQKGEKYVNMDWIFNCAMCHHCHVRKHVCYDIACQWCKNLRERLKMFPDAVQIELPDGSIIFSIPKLHWHSHKQGDHSKFSLNYRVGAGRNDGEGSERRWWELQPIASSTKMMGPGQRQGVLEDHWGYANWRKFVTLAWALRDRLKKALEEHSEHRALLISLTASLKRKHIKQWTAEIIAWEQDDTLDDPYVAISDGPTEAEVRRSIAQEEQTASAMPGFTTCHEVSSLGFITTALDIEDSQVRLRMDAKGALESHLPALYERRTALRKRIQKLRELQGVYMPGALPLLAQLPEAQTDTELMEGVRLGLPSDISRAHRDTACNQGLVNLESRLREAQCRDALQDIRNKLHTLHHLHQFKKTNVRHQGPNTRARSELDQHAQKRDRAVEKYRRARRAKLALDGSGEWELILCELHDEDIRGVTPGEDEVNMKPSRKRKRNTVASGPGEGHRKISWIWNASDAAGSASHVESLRIEWLKARARSMRWQEETKLLPEEMRRSLVSMQVEEKVWLGRAVSRDGVDARLQEGLTAYAVDQALVRRCMRVMFRDVCVDVARAADGDLGPEWGLTGNDPAVNTDGYRPSDATAQGWNGWEDLE